MVDYLNTALRRVPAWLLYIVLPLPAFWFLYLGLTGGSRSRRSSRSLANSPCNC